MTTSGLIAPPPQGMRLGAHWLKKLTCSLIPLSIVSVAYATDWMPIATYADGTTLSVDAASIGPSGKYKKGWFKILALQAADLPEGTIPSTTVPAGQKFTYVVELFYAKCAKHSAALIEANFYGTDDSLLGNIPPIAVNHADFEEAPPGSAGDKIIHTLCKTG